MGREDVSWESTSLTTALLGYHDHHLTQSKDLSQIQGGVYCSLGVRTVERDWE